MDYYELEAQIREKFLEGSGANFQVSNIQRIPNSNIEQYGVFSNAQDIVGSCPNTWMTTRCPNIQNGKAFEGVVISTGSVYDIDINVIQNNKQFEGKCFMGAGQLGCERTRNVAPGLTFDHAGFTAQFTAQGSGNFEFNYVFASTELPRYGGQNFTDEFELKVNNNNIAKLCGCGSTNAASCSASNDPKQVVTINNLTPKSGLDPSLPGEPPGNIIQFPAGTQPGRAAPILASETNQWSPLFRANIMGVNGNGRGASGDAGSSLQDTVIVPNFWPKTTGPFVFSGFTCLLAAQTPVTANITYTLNVTIYDVTDGYFDSALFLTGPAQVSLPTTPTPTPTSPPTLFPTHAPTHSPTPAPTRSEGTSRGEGSIGTSRGEGSVSGGTHVHTHSAHMPIYMFTYIHTHVCTGSHWVPVPLQLTWHDNKSITEGCKQCAVFNISGPKSVTCESNDSAVRLSCGGGAETRGEWHREAAVLVQQTPITCATDSASICSLRSYNNLADPDRAIMVSHYLRCACVHACVHLRACVHQYTRAGGLAGQLGA